MFVPFLKSTLEKTELTKRRVKLCSGSMLLLLFVQAANGGDYQRTKDGKTLVWNNFPSENDLVSWTGKRDSEGYATGKGTITWYKSEKEFETGSLLPSKPAVTVVTRYSGTMVRGKLNGPVINVDPDGKMSRVMFVNGMKNRGRNSASAALVDRSRDEKDEEKVAAPAEGPRPSPVDRPAPKATPGQTSMAYQTPATNEPPSPPDKPTLEIASIKSGGSPSAPPSPEAIDSIVKDRIITDFKDETQAVLSQVAGATDNFRNVDRLDSVGKLPEPVSESVASLTQRARDFRSKVGYETALRDYRTETGTVDALAAVDQVTRNIAANDSAAANAKLAEFLKSNPDPSADSQKGLWQYLTSIQQVCGRLQRDAEIHSRRAESFAAAGRTSEAIRELQEAYRIFPNPGTAEKIRQFQANSLGL